MIVLIDNLRSIHNTASIFRTADAAGVSEIVLCGTTPQPTDKWGRDNPAFTKVSLGAEKTVSWKYVESSMSAIKTYKDTGYKILALEQAPSSQNIFKYKASEPQVLVVGPERTGMSSEVLKMCDTILEIPMFGKKESLNVSVAFGIAIYALTVK